MNRLCIGCLAVAMAATLAAPAMAQRVNKQIDTLADMTITGKVQKSETTIKAKNGEDKTIARYLLIKADGTQVMLPGILKKGFAEKSTANADVERLVGKQVVVVGKGFVVGKMGGGREPVTRIMLKTIEGIKEASAAAEAAPAKTEAAPAKPEPAPAAPAPAKTEAAPAVPKAE